MTNTGGASSTRRAPPGFLEWIDRHSSQIFIWPAVIMILIFSIFPLIASAVLALARVRLRGGGFQVRFVWFDNFAKQFFGSEQYHFLGTFTRISVVGWIVTIVTALLLLWWLWTSLRRPGFWFWGLVGRAILALLVFGLVLMLAATLFSDNQFGTLGVTLFYVILGCTLQFLIGLGLALLCAQPIRGRTFFRVLFFLPLMITPIGIGYIFRMMADTSKGPFSVVWQWAGLGDFSWAANAWAARFIIVVADSWQWIPFIFVVLLAALENVQRDMVEAAHVDGASQWQIFTDVTWPQIVPVASTVMLIRVIEAFKIVDLPNIMTAGGPGIATESMTLHAFYIWRATDLGNASAISYLLLFVTVILCVSFFNLVILRHRAEHS